MKFYFLKKLIRNKGVIDGFHYKMFHGWEASLGGGYADGGGREQPLRLEKNVFEIAHVFAPGVDLVVSETVRRAVGTLPGVEPRRVEFVRTFSRPYRARDFSHWVGDKNWCDVQRMIDAVPHDPGAGVALAPYYELVTPLHEDVARGVRGLDRFDFPCGAQPPAVVHVNAELLGAWPMTWEGGLVLARDAFSLLEPFLNWDYFAVREGVVR